MFERFREHLRERLREYPPLWCSRRNGYDQDLRRKVISCVSTENRNRWWHEEFGEMKREVERNRLRKSQKEVGKEDTGSRRAAVVWELQRYGGRLLKILRVRGRR